MTVSFSPCKKSFLCAMLALTLVPGLGAQRFTRTVSDDGEAVLTAFLQSHDWTGKTVIPFTTHEGSGWGNGLKDLADMIPSARILPGLAIPGHKVATSGKEIAAFVGK